MRKVGAARRLVVSLVISCGWLQPAAVSASQTCGSDQSVSDGDLALDASTDGIFLHGSVDRATAEEVRSTLDQLTGNKRVVCDLIRVGGPKRTIDQVAIRTLVDLDVNDQFTARWGGGGLTVRGWVSKKSLERIRSLGTATFPVDVRSVGVLDALPSAVRLGLQSLTLSRTRFVQFEQFHPQVGPIRIETDSKMPLVACPGGWRGKQATAETSSWGRHWKNGRCVSFRQGKPANLPNAWSSDYHLSVLVRAEGRLARNVSVALTYTAMDPSSQCFVGGNEITCEPYPNSIQSVGAA